MTSWEHREVKAGTKGVSRPLPPPQKLANTVGVCWGCIQSTRDVCSQRRMLDFTGNQVSFIHNMPICLPFDKRYIISYVPSKLHNFISLYAPVIPLQSFHYSTR
jgi:hypothetical protein